MIIMCFAAVTWLSHSDWGKSGPRLLFLGLLTLINREDLILMQTEELFRDEGFLVSSTPLNGDVRGVCQTVESQEQIPIAADTGRFAISRLIFSEDRRFVEALRMIEPVRVTIAECIPDQSWSEAQLFEAQKEVAWLNACFGTYEVPPENRNHTEDAKLTPFRNAQSPIAK